MKTAPETLEAYAQRLRADCAARPQFYFARRELPIIDAEVEAFKLQRLALGKMILHFRSTEKRAPVPAMAWPRNLSEMVCNMCEFQAFCLNGVCPTPEDVPEGFHFGVFNPELEKAQPQE